MTGRAFEKALNEELLPLGITFQQWQILAALALEGELFQCQLADRLRIQPPTLIGTLDRMERDGWIRRTGCADDRRKKVVRPTPRVLSVWDKLCDCARRVRTRATRGVDTEDLAQVKEVLAAIRANMDRNGNGQRNGQNPPNCRNQCAGSFSSPGTARSDVGSKRASYRRLGLGRLP
ncbi:MAG: MarR family winged helix-turn-helix transcriptional regulator [Gemmataceae bacterium]